MNTEIIFDEYEINSELRALELTCDVLLEALQIGNFERAATTEHHPPNYGGTKMWAETTRHLGDVLAPLGWVRDNSNNLASLINADKTTTLIVASGDVATGNISQNPTTRHDKGIMTQQRVASNQMVLEFNPAARAINRSADLMPDNLKGTWILLHCVVGRELRSELSRPVDIDESGFVRRWSKRLILPPIPLEPNPATMPDDKPTESLPKVSRRGNK